MPLRLDHPIWVEDTHFDIDRHVQLRLAEIEQVKVLAKSGGKSGDWARTGEGTA